MYRKITSNSSSTLDLIRGISSQLVVIGHGISFCGIAKSFHQPNFPWIQSIAVVVFFILSGFLISYSMFGKKENSNYYFSHYIADRFSRIYVAFIPAIVAIILIDTINIKINDGVYRYYNAFNIKTFIGNLFMLQDYPKIGFVTSFGSARPFWTLAIEWWIYLFVGALFFLNLRKKRNITIILFLSIVPIYNLIGGRGNGLTLYWIYGAIMFYLWRINLLQKLSLAKTIIALAFFSTVSSLIVINTKREYDPIFALFLAITILLAIEVSSKIEIHKYVKKFSLFIASYSYTLYLIHYSIFDLLVTRYGRGFTTFLIGFAVSNILAFLMGRLFEVNATKKVKQYIYKYIATSGQSITSKAR